MSYVIAKQKDLPTKSATNIDINIDFSHWHHPKKIRGLRRDTELGYSIFIENISTILGFHMFSPFSPSNNAC